MVKYPEENKMFKNMLKEKLAQGKIAYGPFIIIPHPSGVEIAGMAGFDFVIIDMEHAAYSFETTENMTRAARAVGITPIVRVPDKSQSNVLRALEAGAMVVDVPLVGKASEAEAIVYAAKYAPLGGRGFNLGSMGNRYGFLGNTGQTPARINAEILVMVQIETAEGVENAEAIAAVKNLDMIFVGVGDLSQSLGIPCDWENPKLINAVERTIKVARKAGKHVCVFTISPQMGKRWLSAGACMMALGSEASAIRNGFIQMYNEYEKMVSEFEGQRQA